MNRALFVSDIHISSPQDAKCILFEHFLDAVLKSKTQKLFLVGDIFDLWIADRQYFVTRYAKTIDKIKALVSGGVEVHYFEGNHDLDLKKFWEDQIGAKVHTEAQYFALQDLKVRVEHGDQMDPEDRGYLFLRWLLRTPVMRFLGRHLPNALVGWIGTRASQASREYTSEVKTVDASTAIAKIRDHGKKVFVRQPFDIFISGHLHETEDSSQTVNGLSFRCVNLGTWLKTPMVLQLTGQESELLTVNDWLRLNS